MNDSRLHEESSKARDTTRIQNAQQWEKEDTEFYLDFITNLLDDDPRTSSKEEELDLISDKGI